MQWYSNRVDVSDDGAAKQSLGVINAGAPNRIEWRMPLLASQVSLRLLSHPTLLFISPALISAVPCLPHSVSLLSVFLPLSPQSLSLAFSFSSLLLYRTGYFQTRASTCESLDCSGTLFHAPLAASVFSISAAGHCSAGDGHHHSFRCHRENMVADFCCVSIVFMCNCSGG